MTLLGFDVSHHQGSVDFAAAKRAGNSFVILKATEGTGYTDPTFAANRAAARAAGLTVGFYAFASAGNPASEADYFCAVVGALQHGDLVVLDWETTTANPPAWCKTWLNRVHAKLGVRPLIYMNQSTRDRFDWSPVVAGDYGLWLAAYDGTQSVPNPGHWPNVAIKQFTSSGTVPGVAGLVDRNVFFGDAVALAAYGYQEADMQVDSFTPAALDQVVAAIVDRQVDGSTRLWQVLRDLHQQLPAVAKAVAAIPTGQAQVDPKALAAAIVAALPAAQAQEVAARVIAGLDGARLNVTPPAA